MIQGCQKYPSHMVMMEGNIKDTSNINGHVYYYHLYFIPMRRPNSSLLNLKSNKIHCSLFIVHMPNFKVVDLLKSWFRDYVKKQIKCKILYRSSNIHYFHGCRSSVWSWVNVKVNKKLIRDAILETQAVTLWNVDRYISLHWFEIWVARAHVCVCVCVWLL